MEGCIYFILLAIALFALATAISAIIATFMSLYTLIAYRRWNWKEHFSSVFGVLMHVVSFLLDVFGSSSRSSGRSSSHSSGSKSDSSFGGGSSRGGGSGRSF